MTDTQDTEIRMVFRIPNDNNYRTCGYNTKGNITCKNKHEAENTIFKMIPRYNNSNGLPKFCLSYTDAGDKAVKYLSKKLDDTLIEGNTNINECIEFDIKNQQELEYQTEILKYQCHAHGDTRTLRCSTVDKVIRYYF